MSGSVSRTCTCTSACSCSSSVEAPARLAFRPAEACEPWTDLRTEKLELISRGDLVSGLRIRALSGADSAKTARPPLLLLIHDAAGDACAPEWRPVASWLRRGGETVAVALDLALHGPRSSAKLSERLVAAFAAQARGAFLDRNGTVLVDEFLRQSTHDLARALDALLRPGEIDPTRVALIGLGLGARVAEAWLAQDDRVAAAVLVRTRRAPALRSSDAPGRLEIDAQEGERDWAGEAARFLGSRIGL